MPLAVAAVAAVAYLAAELYVFSGELGFPLDDSWIHLQFARQAAAGEGLAFNPGIWIAGSTAPLWTALLALVFALPIAPFWGVKLLGMALFLVSVDATGRLGAELGLSRGLARLAATMAAASHWLVWSALSGMEILLFTALALWGMVLHLRGDRAGLLSLPVLASACLARPEGYLLFAAALADRVLRAGGEWRRELRRMIVPVAAAALVLVPTLVFYRLIGDSFLPTTFAVKSNPDPDFLPKGRYLRAVVDVFFRSQPILLIFAGAGIVRLLERFTAARRGVAPPGSSRGADGLLVVAWMLGLPFVYSLLAADRGPVVVGNFGRYYFPLVPLVAVLGVLGLSRLVRRLAPVPRVALVAAVVLPQLWGLYTGVGHYLRTIDNVTSSDVAAGRWLAEKVELGELEPGAPLAVQDIGAIKYHVPNPVLDLTGIVNPEILPRLRAADWQDQLLEWMAVHRPAYLVVFPEYYPDIVRAPGFRAVRSFPIRDNVTMAGNELVVFATPWNAAP